MWQVRTSKQESRNQPRAAFKNQAELLILFWFGRASTTRTHSKLRGFLGNRTLLPTCVNGWRALLTESLTYRVRACCSHLEYHRSHRDASVLATSFKDCAGFVLELQPKANKTTKSQMLKLVSFLGSVVLRWFLSRSILPS